MCNAFKGRLRDRAIICGGHDGTYERAECFALHSNAKGRWSPMTPDLGQPLIFAAAAGDSRDNFYVVGGRRFDFNLEKWEYNISIENCTRQGDAIFIVTLRHAIDNAYVIKPVKNFEALD